MLPTVTAGITCYNAEATIARTVTSVLFQDLRHLEIVVVDDGSTDSSWSILNELAGAHSCIRLIRHQENRGYPAALNAIVAVARGTFVAFFDDDDDYEPDRLSAQLERLSDYESQTGALVFCYSNRKVVKAGMDHPDHIAYGIGRKPVEPHGLQVADYVLGLPASPHATWGMFGSGTLMARKSSFLEVGPFDEDFRRSAELDFAVRAGFKDAHFISVDRPLCTQYKTATADKAGDIPLKYALKLRRKHRDYLRGRHSYLASRAIAFSNFYGNTERKWRSRFFRMLALLLNPALMPSFLRARRDKRA